MNQTRVMREKKTAPVKRTGQPSVFFVKLRSAGLQALFAVYIYVLFKIILFKFSPIDFRFLWHQLQRSPDTILRQLRLGNFTPLETVYNTFDPVTITKLVNLVGNIALFIPFGIFIALLSSNRQITWFGVMLRAFGVSAVLECAQGLFSIGTFDVDDLLLNTLGGVLGYCLLKIWQAGQKARPAQSRDDGQT
ncbi:MULTISPECIES: VanZ family protein [unclassified Paenibacillus]|uniref:VanZ family protein n=1 Tax=unclassified Paenibacillus TaxID=185978 RepID=UPI002406A2DF|nr:MULTISPECIES: VanZ family protein [unclassified Paenibacillus]MDF9845081.1 glycopeptide antibiotics resistance protein [Paenibacillus sp. PastF-2]MDF9851688.1 glycopeptide antibiotics resistance protein [Paenibacillus sp. PastM-2]MDF9858272.1 glycopeptide antibiotics resistance protein [Paenibacillus sp. PastF-1]MDH6483536.1 glycopeptide antibiotics resistance protein [Paenibacillus sp. PastH-2]MDH6510940.1 glycopeptide antibiotics resistance protein [Paenibacillus sp. PastM-3]